MGYLLHVSFFKLENDLDKLMKQFLFNKHVHLFKNVKSSELRQVNLFLKNDTFKGMFFFYHNNYSISKEFRPFASPLRHRTVYPPYPHRLLRF